MPAVFPRYPLTLAMLVVSACATGVITDPGREPGRNGSGVNVAGSAGAGGMASDGDAADATGGMAAEAMDAGDSGAESEATDAGDGGPVVDEGALPPCL